jgi:hypothetical protein
MMLTPEEIEDFEQRAYLEPGEGWVVLRLGEFFGLEPEIMYYCGSTAVKMLEISRRQKHSLPNKLREPHV